MADMLSFRTQGDAINPGGLQVYVSAHQVTWIIEDNMDPGSTTVIYTAGSSQGVKVDTEIAVVRQLIEEALVA